MIFDDLKQGGCEPNREPANRFRLVEIENEPEKVHFSATRTVVTEPTKGSGLRGIVSRDP